jgi:hypothetical protein
MIRWLIGIILLLVIATPALSATAPDGKQYNYVIIWTNPTTYSDGSPISDVDRPKLKTYLYWRTKDDMNSKVPWKHFAGSALGAEFWGGKDIPSLKGEQGYYCVRTSLNGKYSKFSNYKIIVK